MSNQLAARLVGLLILISTSSYMYADSALVAPLLGMPNYLELAYLDKNSTFALAVLLYFINSVAIVSAAIVLFPILEQISKRTAVTYLTCRIVEGIILIFAATALLSLANLGKEWLQAANTEVINSMATVIRRERYTLFQFAMLSLGIGSIVLNVTFFKYRLVPKALAVLGIIGYTLLVTKMIGELFALPLGGSYLYIPGGLFELLLPLWLIVKGFQLPAKNLEPQVGRN